MTETQRPERWIERNDWTIWAATAVIFVLFGVGDIQMGGSTFAGGEAVLFSGITGMTWDEFRAADPAGARFIDSQVRIGGVELLLVGALTLAIAIYGLRRGQRWAWLTMWLWPGWLVLGLLVVLVTERVPGAGVPVPAISGSIFLVILVVTLVFSYPKYRHRR